MMLPQTAIGPVVMLNFQNTTYHIGNIEDSESSVCLLETESEYVIQAALSSQSSSLFPPK